jgi:hypothetical protein
MTDKNDMQKRRIQHNWVDIKNPLLSRRHAASEIAMDF